MSDPNPFGKSADEEDKNPFGRNLSEENPFGKKAEPAAPTLDRFGQPAGTGEMQLPPISRRESTQGRVSSAGGQFMRSFGAVIASIPKAVGEGAVALANKFGDDPIWGNPDKATPEATISYQMGEAIEKWFNKFSVNPKYAEEFNQQLASGGGSLGAFLLGGFAGRAAGIPAAVTAGGLGATATGVEQIEDYLSTLAKDEKANPEIRENALYWGGLLGTSEALPITKILNRLDKVSDGGVKKILKEGVKGGVEELTQEVLQQFGKNYGARDILAYDPDRGLFAGVQEAGEVGFTLGFMLNTLAAMVGSRRGGRIQQREEQADSKAGLDRGEPLEATDVMGDEFTLEIAEDEPAQVDLEAAPAPEAFEQQGDQDQAGVVPGVGEAARPITPEPTPGTELSTISYFDNRLKRDIYRDRLKSLVDDDLVPGGGIALVPDHNFIGGETDVRDENGRPQAPLVRTPSLNPDWFQSLMQDSNYQMSVEKIRQAADKAIAGDRLGVRQARVLGAVLDHITTERLEAVDYVREQLRIAREARAAAGLPEGTDWYFEESEYLDEFDGITRSFTELLDQAQQLDARLAEQVEALMESQRTDQEILGDITNLIGEYNGRKSQASTEILEAAQEQAAIQGAGIEPEPGIPAAAVPAAEREPRRGPAEPAAAAEPGLTLPPIAPEQRAKAPAAPSEGVTPAEKKALLTDRRKKKQPGRKRERRDIGREDRRKQWLQRKEVEEMGEAERKAAIEELRKELMTDPLTGLGSRAAWEAVDKKEFFAAIDADSLKYVNDELGNEAGDQLLKKIGAALKAEFGEDAYHVSGDEYWVHADSMDDLAISLDAVQQVLLQEIARGPGGSMKGLGFSWGIAKTEAEADRDMKADKKERTKQGLRVERGEKPAGVVLKGETIEKVQPPAKQDLAAAKQEVGKKPETMQDQADNARQEADQDRIVEIIANYPPAENIEASKASKPFDLKLTKNEKTNLNKVQKLKASIESELKDRIKIHNGYRDRGLDAVSDYDIVISGSGDPYKAFDQALRLTSNHVLYSKNQQKWVDEWLDDHGEKKAPVKKKHPGKKKPEFDLTAQTEEAAAAEEEAAAKAVEKQEIDKTVEGFDLELEVTPAEESAAQEDLFAAPAAKPPKKAPGKKSDAIFVGETVELGARRIFTNNIEAPTDTAPGTVETTTVESRDKDGNWVPVTKSKVQKWSWGEFQRATGRYPNVKEAEKKPPSKKKIDKAAHEAAASPLNDKKPPTKDQIKADNYAKGHFSLQGREIAIENPEGSVRKPEWSPMAAHYGDLKGTIGADGDPVDVFVKPGLDKIPDDNPILVIDQKINSKFDEHKVMMGFDSAQDAQDHYKRSFTPKWIGNPRNGVQNINQVDKATLDEWLADMKANEAQRKKPFEQWRADQVVSPAAEPAKYAEFEGREITWDQLDENGNEITITVDAAEIMRDYDERIDNLDQLVKDCG